MLEAELIGVHPDETPYRQDLEYVVIISYTAKQQQYQADNNPRCIEQEHLEYKDT